MPSVVNMMSFLEYGKPFPKQFSKRTEIVSSETLIGYLKYTERKDANDNSFAEVTSNSDGYFGYTSEREGSTSTYTNQGWLKCRKETKDFRELLNNYFNKDGDLVWIPVQSYKDFTSAKQYGLFQAEDYAAITEAALVKFFKRVGFDEENMIWWMNYHTNQNHPHVHLAFLEKEITRTRGKFTAKELTEFKGFIYSEMNKRERLLNDGNDVIKEKFKKIEIQRIEVKKLVSNIIAQNSNRKIEQSITRLFKELPKNGRLQYGSVHMKDFRPQLDEIVDLVLKDNSTHEEYQKLSKSWKNMDDETSAALHEKVTKVFDAEDEKLRRQIANDILREFKDYNRGDIVNFKSQGESYKSRETDANHNFETSNSFMNHKEYSQFVRQNIYSNALGEIKNLQSAVDYEVEQEQDIFYEEKGRKKNNGNIKKNR